MKEVISERPCNRKSPPPFHHSLPGSSLKLWALCVISHFARPHQIMYNRPKSFCFATYSNPRTTPPLFCDWHCWKILRSFSSARNQVYVQIMTRNTKVKQKKINIDQISLNFPPLCPIVYIFPPKLLR